MGRPTRTKAQREYDRAEIAKLVREGKSFYQIKMILKSDVTEAQIRYDWRKCLRELKDDRLEDTEIFRNQKLAEYANIKAKAIESYELSKVPEADLIEDENKASTTAGDPRWLVIWANVIADERKLLGCDLPPIKQLAVPTNPEESRDLLEFILPHLRTALKMLREEQQNNVDMMTPEQLLDEAHKYGMTQPVVTAPLPPLEDTVDETETEVDGDSFSETGDNLAQPSDSLEEPCASLAEHGDSLAEHGDSLAEPCASLEDLLKEVREQL